MAQLPINVTSYGVGSDNLADSFHIWFLSVHNSRKLFLGEGCLTESLGDALTSDDINFVTDELVSLLNDKDFMDYLQSEMVF